MKRLQVLLQWLFLHAEGVFNRAFGDRLNPLYHLGAITFLLFWIVGASGLYLFAFFKTGVADAYSSVQALTHDQWFAGGLLRSVHRYASDAMVLTMALHLVRHFAFDRFHAWRWFSWVTGVALVWGVFVSGINGYMLPWDRLAQFVIVSCFEWLDTLPSFGGTLMRNFIHPDSVGDRFFSLLSFMHIGLPLGVLLLMWVHVQRVPHARTTPPRAIAFSLMAALVVLALLRPALSQGGPADLATAVTHVALDWFYLALFPLMLLWPAGRLWALALGGTALLAALPLWPPAWRRQAGGTHQVSVHGSDGGHAQFRVRPDETLLEAGLRAGIALPHECRNGACGLCLCSVEQGTVAHRPFQRQALPEAAQAAGRALLCCALAQDDLAIALDGPLAVAATPVRRYIGRVTALERLAPDVMRVLIALPGDDRIAFSAGQYIQVVLPDGQRRAFSFANPPHENAAIELHVRRIPGGRFTGQVFETMRVGDALAFEGPHGDFTLRESTRPLLFVAGATGFAPVRSILLDAFQRGIRRPMRLYWGVRQVQDLYQLAQAQEWAQAHDHFQVVPVLSEPPAEAGAWTGRTGLVHEALLADYADLSGFEIYVCGSVRMVDAAVPEFLAHGLAEGACFTDAFLPSASPA